jgi:NADH-quinone oxidoreductase subunit L
MNQISDLGFLRHLLDDPIFRFHRFLQVFSKAGIMPSNDKVLVGITLLLFIGATGKSAQIPLYTWLPDAMAGPTPVSALYPCRNHGDRWHLHDCKKQPALYTGTYQPGWW